MREHRMARAVTWIIIGINFALLALALGDYRAVPDSGYHISLAQWYAHHGVAWWDHINYGPIGRPNLQGPGLHVAIAALGLLLGGWPGEFILANSILGLAQWCAAIATVHYFARRFGGDIAAMFAVALIAGAGFASGSFYICIPSGWVFIAAPWAILFFLDGRLVLATAVTSAACYTHLGGYLTVPVGIFVAAAIERRWSALIKVGIATAIVTSPYTIHFLANLSWYRGRHGHEALRLDPMLDFLSLAGFVWAVTRKERSSFLIAWALAPATWILQDYTRFVLQSALAGSVLAGLMLADLVMLMRSRGARVAFASVIVAFAALFPFGVPAVAAEGSWIAGAHFPLLLDWSRARAMANVIDRNHLNDELLSVYYPSFGPAIAVFTPAVLEKGHWVEVQPPHDLADDLSAGVKTYVVPLAPNDPMLLDLQNRGWLKVYGGDGDTCVLRLAERPAVDAAQNLFLNTVAENARWLSEHARNNNMPPAHELIALATRAGVEARRRWTDEQRFHAARMETAMLVYAFTDEPTNPSRAKGLRRGAAGFGMVAAFLSDGDPVGFVDDARHQRLRDNMAALACVTDDARSGRANDSQIKAAFDKMFDQYLGGAA